MTTDAVGGVWTYSLDLAASLRPRGIDVELATMGPPPSRGQLADAERICAGVHVSSYALEWQDEPWDDVERAGEWLLELADELQPHVVHLNGYAHGSLPWCVPVVVVAHSDVLSWWEAVHGTPPVDRERYRRAVEVGLRAADTVLAPTAAVAADLARHYRLCGSPLVVPNGRNLIPRISRKAPFVLAVGRFWDEAKNLAALQRIAGRLTWPVVAVGPGAPLGSRTEAELEELRASASIFCSPARYEPFGLAPLEAALAGCALVLGDVPSLREVWGDAALFAPPDDDEALLAALRLLVKNAELCEELGVRARRRASRYGADRMAERVEVVYRSLLASEGVVA
jgi:glycosyltransferase involved in cell wall biosynthesis